MSELDESEPQSPNGDAAEKNERLRCIRVRGTGASEEAEPAFVVLERTPEGQLIVGSGESLRPVLTEFLADKSRGGRTEEERWSVLCEFLAERGYDVEDVPTTVKRRFTLSVDADTGRVVGSDQLIDGFGADEIAQGVFESLRSLPSRLLREATADVMECLETEDHDGAAAAILNHQSEGALVLGVVHEALADALRLVDADQVEISRRLAFRRLRACIAAENADWKQAAGDAEFILENNATESDAERATFRLMLASAAAARGHRETAYETFRRLAEDPATDPGNRASAYSSLVALLRPQDEACQRFAELAAGMFASMGDPKRAAMSWFRAAESSATRDPASALPMLDVTLDNLSADGPGDRDLRGRALFERARMAHWLGKPDRAFEDAVEAASCLRGVFGATDLLWSSLGLAVHLGGLLGKDIQALEEEYAQISQGDEFEIRDRLAKLATQYDPKEADDIAKSLKEAWEEPRDLLNVLRANHDDRLSESERLELLESACKRERSGAKGLPLVALPALAGLLARTGEKERALAVYREVLDRDPFEQVARQNYSALLLDLGRYELAVPHFEHEIRVHGDLPGLHYALGRALFDKGDVNGAATEFAGVMAMDGVDAGLRKAATDWFRRATERKGVVQKQVPLDPPPVTPTVWETALSDFAQHVKRGDRMRFWQGTGDKRKWVKCPEKVASGLLQAFLSGRFGGRIEQFRELNAGAGRIDLYIMLHGGLRLVVELKMLGGGSYSSTYAFSGTDQITHYMDNRECRLGYLILFDARTRDWGKRPSDRPEAPNKVTEQFVDVRPEVKIDKGD